MQVNEAYIAYRTTNEQMPENRLKTAASVVSLMRDVIEQRRDQEQLWVLLLDTKLKLIARSCCFVGTVDFVVIHPREILPLALLSSAHSIIIVHNHPSGDPQASEEDLRATRQLTDACVQIGIPLVDHVIIGRAEADPQGRGYWSFMESGD